VKTKGSVVGVLDACQLIPLLVSRGGHNPRNHGPLRRQEAIDPMAMAQGTATTSTMQVTRKQIRALPTTEVTVETSTIFPGRHRNAAAGRRYHCQLAAACSAKVTKEELNRLQLTPPDQQNIPHDRFRHSPLESLPAASWQQVLRRIVPIKWRIAKAEREGG
jgi:hypothetical protein